MKSLSLCLSAAVSLAGAASALAQTLPTTQPNYLQIYREEVKVGRGADHARTEAGWPSAYEKSNSPYSYIALTSMTGVDEAWFVVPFESHEQMADAMKRDDEMAPTLDRLRRADAEHLSGARSILARARKDLSRGAFPDTAKQRFYEVTIFRVRPGHGRGFEAAAKAYGAAAERGAPSASYRVYEVMAGMPSPTYLVFSSVPSYGAFDKAMAEELAIMKAANAEEMAVLEKFSTEGVVNTETIRFRLDPRMSFVNAEVRAQDPAFWNPKPAAVATSGQTPPKKGDKR
jgi:hypothetical protein